MKRMLRNVVLAFGAALSACVVLAEDQKPQSLDQLLDFLSNLNENPYLVGVEELRIQCDTKEPPEKRKDKEIEIDLTVSTFVK